MIEQRGSLGFSALFLAASLLGCGGSGGSSGPPPVAPQGCGMVDPCGGDLTGTWKILGGCSDALFWLGSLTCPPNTPEELVGLGYTGTVTFNSDMTYSSTIVSTGAAPSFPVPSACLPLNVTCSQILPGCTGPMGGPCTCRAVGAGAAAVRGSGVYSLPGGNQILFSPQPSSTISGTVYCVQDELLHLETNAIINQSDGTRISPVTSDIVAQKQ
jgi:hypothetical protein